SHTAFVGQNAVAASSEAGQTRNEEAQPRLRLAQNTKAAKKTDTEANVSEGAEAAAKGEISILSAAARAVNGKQAPIPVIDEETPPLIPPLRNVANATSKATRNGRRRSMPMRRSRRCSTRSSRSFST